MGITFVTDVDTDLRGFAGINKVFLNASHFTKKKKDYLEYTDINPEVLDLLLLIDIISVVIHEYSNIKLRKYTDNFNISTPFLARISELPESHFEFGRFIEIEIFGIAVDWLKSYKNVSMAYVEKTIEAIESNTSLPPKDMLTGAFSKTACILMAVDFDIEPDLF